MARQIVLHVLAVANHDPMALLATTAETRARAATYSRTFALAYDPPPDTLFMRATRTDLSVFGEDLPRGHLLMIDGASLAERVRALLSRLVDSDAEATVGALLASSKGAASRAEIATALSDGSWPTSLDARRGAVVQAAGFARQLAIAAGQAWQPTDSIVWEYTGGRCTYAY